MAEKIEWYGEIPSNVNWLTFADQSDKGYKYNNDFTQITATTDDNGGNIPDEIKFVVDYNSGVSGRTCEVKFTQKGGEISFCYISQNGISFEQIWKHAPKQNDVDEPTDAVISQSNNETQNSFEVAVGNYNVTRMGLLFSVGSGEDENHRQNSFEVDKNKIKAYNGYINSLTANTLTASTIENDKIQSDKADINSLTANTITVKDKINADKADISHLTANTFSATTICATTIVNENGTNFDFGNKVSYTAATKSTDANAYKIGTLKIDDKTTDIYGISGSTGGSTGGSGDGTYPKDADFDSITAGTLSARTITADEGHFNDLKTTEFSATSAFISALTAAETTTEYLNVTREAHFKKLIIDEVKSVGGQIILSCANAIIDKVETLEDGNKYKLSWLAKDGKNRDLDNQFEVDDYVVCQNFDAKEDTSYSASTQYYWRKCLSASTETISGNEYNYIVIEGADGTKGKGQGIPNVGDNIAQLGHVGGGERANAIVLSAYQSGFLDQGGDAGDGVIVSQIKAPSIVQYSNIGAQKNGVNFSWNLFPYRYTVISNGLNLFRGKFIVQDGGTNDGSNVVDLIAKVTSGEGTKLLPIQEDIIVEQTAGSDGNISKKIKASLVYRLVKVAANGYEDLQFDNGVSVKIYKGNSGNQEAEEATYFTGAATEDKNYYKISGRTDYDKNLQYYAVECVNSKNEVIDHRLVYVTMPTSTIFEVTDSAVTISQQASDAVRDLANSAITQTNFQHYYNSYASGLINSFSSFTKNFNSYSGNVEQEITNVNSLVSTVSSNTLTLSDTVTNLSGQVVSNTTKIEQTASSITLSVQENVENKLAETGIDIKNNVINLKADTTNFLGSDGKEYIKVQKDDKGMPHLIFYGTDGTTPLYDLGYTGLRTLVTNSNDGKFSPKICLVNIGDYLNTDSYASNFMKMTEENSAIIPAYKYFASYFYSNGTIVYGNDEEYDGNYYNSGATVGNKAEKINWLKDSNNLIPDGYYAEWEKVYMQEIGSMGIDDLAINNINCIHISNGIVVGSGDMYTRGSKDSNFYYFTDKQGNTLNSADYKYIKDYIFKNQN